MNEARQDLAARLQQRMARDNLQEPLQALPSMLDNVVAEAVGEDLARQRRDGDTGALALEDVAKVLKVGVPAAHAAALELEGWDVCAAENLVGCVHVPAEAVGLRVADLNLEEVLGRAVDLLEGLLARLGEGLHGARRG